METLGTPSEAVDILDRQLTSLSLAKRDYLCRFPTEIRLMIFVELLTVWHRKVFSGAKDFGPLDKKELSDGTILPWQILGTCRLYYEEAMPIMYSRNKLVFCTGKRGEPGRFWRWPVSARCLPHVTHLSICTLYFQDLLIHMLTLPSYMRSDTPTKEAAKRIAHFIKAITRLAVRIQFLTVLISSDHTYERACPWDIMFGDHPVAEALVQLVKAKAVPYLKIRLHDGACLFPNLALFLNQEFYNDAVPGNRCILFTRSCTCMVPYPYQPLPVCNFCFWPRDVDKPIDIPIPPEAAESDMDHMMDLQDYLFMVGLLPPKDNDDVDEDEEENKGPYHNGGIPMEDTHEEDRLAFHSGMLLPGDVRKYRSELKKPAVWFYRQTRLTEFFSGKN